MSIAYHRCGGRRRGSCARVRRHILDLLSRWGYWCVLGWAGWVGWDAAQIVCIKLSLPSALVDAAAAAAAAEFGGGASTDATSATGAVVLAPAVVAVLLVVLVIVRIQYKAGVTSASAYTRTLESPRHEVRESTRRTAVCSVLAPQFGPAHRIQPASHRVILLPSLFRCPDQARVRIAAPAWVRRISMGSLSRTRGSAPHSPQQHRFSANQSQ